MTAGDIGKNVSYIPSETETENFLNGLSVNASAGAGPGVGVTFNPMASGDVLAFERGAYSLQIGLSVMLCFQFFNPKKRVGG